ncbi:MAG: hypothetical protein GY769_07535 [bacterium]|nr:hypothetical protein [bacterium]
MTNPARPRERIPWLRREALLVLCFILVSFGLNWFYLLGGFQADEFFFLNALREDPLPFSRWLGLWSVEEVSAISGIWWFEGGDLGVFWRPVPSLVFEGSIRLFGERALPLHLLSVVIHGLIAAILFLLVRRLTGRPLLGLLTGVFFLACEDHSMTVGWIATLTDLICSLFVMIALTAHAAWLEKRAPRQLAVSVAALLLALLSKESAVVAPFLLVLMTLLVPRGREEECSATAAASLRARAVGFLGDRLSWIPALVVLVAYLVAFKVLGFGGMSSGVYIDPLVDPGRFLVQLTRHVPVMWLAALSPVPPSLAMFMPGTIPLLAVAGALLFAVFITGLWWMRRSAVALWALAVFFLALIPQMSAGASERALYLPAIGSSILLAMLLGEIGPIARRVASEASPAPGLTRTVGWIVLVAVLVPGIILSAAYPFMYMPSLEHVRENVATAVPHIQERQPEHVLLLNAPGFFYVFYPPPIIDFYVGRATDVRVLSALNGIVSVERSDDRSFVISTDREGWLTNTFARMFRPPGIPEPGTVYDKGLVKATVVDITSSGKDVAAVRFELDRPLDDRGLLFLRWDGATYLPIELAALRVGERVTLADTSDVWASMM